MIAMIAHLQRNIGIVGGGDSPDFFHLFPAGFAGSIIGGMQSLKGQLLVATPALKETGGVVRASSSCDRSLSTTSPSRTRSMYRK